MKLPNSTITWLKQQIKICDESKEANPKQIAEWMQTLQDQLLDGYKKNKRLMQTLKNRGLS